jgi:hypothetical protein
MELLVLLYHTSTRGVVDRITTGIPQQARKTSFATSFGLESFIEDLSLDHLVIIPL